MPTTVRIPLALMTVQPDTGNAFWLATTRATIDQGHVAFIDGGLGIATWWGIIPSNVNATPAWNLEAYSEVDSGVGGNGVFSFDGRVIAHATSLNGAYTSLLGGGTLLVQTAGLLTIMTANATNLDGTLVVSANSMLLVQFTRHGQVVGDTLAAQFNVLGMIMRIDL